VFLRSPGGPWPVFLWGPWPVFLRVPGGPWSVFLRGRGVHGPHNDIKVFIKAFPRPPTLSPVSDESPASRSAGWGLAIHSKVCVLITRNSLVGVGCSQGIEWGL
jgi:hypothetical protein